MRKSNLHPKITSFIEHMLCDLSLSYQFYGEFCNYINFSEDKRIPTMGVNVTKHGMNWIYNSDFADKLTQPEMNYVGIHEILHLMYNHPKRTREHHNHYLANVAQDMIINHIIDKDFSKKFCKRPDGILELPKEYETMVNNGTAKLYFEDVYNWILAQQEKYEEEKQQNGKSQGQPQDSNGQGSGSGSGTPSNQQGSGSGTPTDGRPDKNGKYPNGYTSKIDKQLRDIFDSHSDDPDKSQTLDEHMQNEIDDDVAREIVNQVKEGLKARGLGKGNVETVLDKLEKKRKDYLKEIKRSVNTLKGSSAYSTITRPSRIGQEGIKGKRRTGKGLNVLLDTSGSMSGDFEKVLSYIFQRNIVVNLVQCDTVVQKYDKITSLKDFKELRINGLGGTELQPGIEYLKTTKELAGFNVVVLTDGYCDSLNFSGIPGCKKALIISSGIEVKIKSENKLPVKQIVIDKSI